MEIVIKPDLVALSEYAAELFVARAGADTENGGRFSVALSGGSTPKELYRLLASASVRERIDWARVYFFFSDERCVPPDSPESNYRMADETLLTPLEVPDSNIFRWHGEEKPEKAAADYEFEIKSFFRSDMPVFDLVLLGMGSDGHTASLFPHSPALHESESLAVSNWVEKLNSFRLTFTYRLINNAANVMFLVAGKDKAEVLARVLRGEGRVEELPSRGVQPEDGNLIWAVDASAASLLNTDEI